MLTPDRYIENIASTVTPHLARLLVAASVFSGTLGVVTDPSQAQSYGQPVQHESPIELDRNASVSIDALATRDNIFSGCSATRIGTLTFLSARHCFITTTELDKDIITPYDARAAHMPLPPYALGNSAGVLFNDKVTSIVEDPVGEDIAVVKVKKPLSVSTVPIEKLATPSDLADMKIGQTFYMDGYPGNLDGEEADFSVKYLGEVSFAGGLDDNYADPLVPQKFLAFAIPPSMNERNSQEYGIPGESGAAILNAAGRIVAVLSNKVGVSIEQTNWLQLQQDINVEGSSFVCLAPPVTQGLVNTYDSAIGSVPASLVR